MDLLKMAQDAGFDVHPRKGEIRSALDFCANDITATVEKFARLVADAEREACAKEAESCATQYDCDLPQPGDKDFRRGGISAAAAIRGRSNAQGNKPPLRAND